MGVSEVYRQVPGYDGRYFISRSGEVINRDCHRIKPEDSKAGLRVELRSLGQRDKPLVKDLIDQVWGDSNAYG